MFVSVFVRREGAIGACLCFLHERTEMNDSLRVRVTSQEPPLLEICNRDGRAFRLLLELGAIYVKQFARRSILLIRIARPLPRKRPA